MQKSLLNFNNILILLFLSSSIFKFILKVNDIKVNDSENKELSKLSSEISYLENKIYSYNIFYNIRQKFLYAPAALKEAAQPTIKENYSIDIKETPPDLAQLEAQLEKKEAEMFTLKRRMLKANRIVYIPIIIMAFFTAFILLILSLLPLFNNNIKDILLLLTILVYLIGEFAIAANSGNSASYLWRICLILAFINSKFSEST